jgi:glycosyltransferase involved in cell wall biosynthesis
LVSKIRRFLFIIKNVEVLPIKLEILIKNPELRKQMGAAGRKKYEEEFTLERFEGRMVEILNEVMRDELQKMTMNKKQMVNGKR